MKWNLTLRIATSPSNRWLRKAADWNPELSTRYRTNRAIGRPRWEDDINELLKQEFEDTEDPIESNNQQNMDQHCQRPRKVGSSRRSLHNDRFKNEKMRQASTTDAFGNSSEHLMTS